MNLRVEARARDDLEQISLEGRRLFGPKQSSVYGAELKNAMSRLLDFPFAFPERTEFDPPVRVCRHKAHVILYRVEGDTVLILRVRHGREDWSAD
ncbi:MAG: type II toxin-antitoxin system RelE/ParE family toxin [Pseudomonadota bacterium]